MAIGLAIQGSREPMELGDSAGYGVRGGLGAVGAAGLAQDVFHVVCDRVEANHQLGCDVLVALAVGYQPEHFHFSGRKAVGSRRESVGDGFCLNCRPGAQEFTHGSLACFLGRFAFYQQVVVAI